MQHYERIDTQNPEILSLTRFGHIERYKLASRLVAPDSVVLDVACGCGYGAEILRRKSSRAIGIDQDRNTIELCQERYLGVRNLDFLVADVRDLPFSASSIGAVVGMEMIEHIPNSEKFLAEAHRVLKSSGTIMISTPYGDNTLLQDGRPFSQYHVKEFTEKEMEQLLSESGFEIQQTYGQYVILGAIMKLNKNHVKPVSNVNAGSTQAIMEKIPFFAEVFSKHYPFLKSTSKNMFYYAIKR